MKNLTLLICLLFVICNLSFATIRYVSHNSIPTPPYTTWETAADSIQKCIDYCVAGDTIIVANGTYYESLVVNKYLSLIGSSMDSTIIDGTALDNTTVYFQSDGYIVNFSVKGKGFGIANTVCIYTVLSDALIKLCRVSNSYTGIGLVESSSLVDKCIMNNVECGYGTYSSSTYSPIISNSIIYINSPSGIGIEIGEGANTALNNIILGNRYNTSQGIGVIFAATRNIIKNNIVSGFNYNIEGYAEDTATVLNNITIYTDTILNNRTGIFYNSKTDLRNNIIAYNKIGTDGPSGTNSDYNLYWQNSII
jgi:hypothetical protein